MKKIMKVLGIIIIGILFIFILKSCMDKDNNSIDNEDIISGHSVNIVSKKEATNDSFGYTLYECDDCELSFRGNLTHSLDNLYGYNYFLNIDKRLSDLYQRIDYICKTINKQNIEPTSININNEKITIYNLGKVKYSDISKEDALKVWTIFYDENPWYYWLENKIIYNDEYLYINVYKEYKDYDTRLKIEQDIIRLEADISKYVLDSMSQREKVIAIHNYIAYKIDYAYVPGTNKPSEEPWAHNIVGLLQNNEGVCECYAKSFFYLCSLYDVYSIVVVGDPNNEGHIYNYVLLDEEWYGVDVTWDDQPSGLLDKYLLANDETMNDHNARSELGEGVYFQYKLPNLSK